MVAWPVDQLIDLDAHA